MATEVLWEIQNVISVMEIDCVCDHEGFILLLKIKLFYFQYIYQGHMYIDLLYINFIWNPHCIKDKILFR